MYARSFKSLLLTLAAGLPLVLTGCDQVETDQAGVFTGERKALGNGTVRSWVQIAADGRPLSLGITMTEAALTGLPAGHDHSGPEAHVVVLGLPDEADEIPINHITVDWNPNGHPPPGIYEEPHFDFHYYLMSEAERAAILPTDSLFGQKGARIPAAQYIPQGYFSPPGNQTVPMMGTHLFDATAPELNGQPFTKTFLYGFYDAEMVLLEPMITKTYLESVRSMPGQSVTTAIAQPQAFAQAGYYPTEYTVRFDAAREEYSIVLSGLKRYN